MAGVGEGGASLDAPANTGRRGRRIWKLSISFLLLMVIMGGGFFLWKRYSPVGSEGPSQAAPVVVSLPDPQAMIPETDPDQVIPSVSLYQSERFRVGDIAIGGEAEFFIPETDVAPLLIGAVRGEAFTEKGKNGAKLVITWETNKPALSEISYGKGVGQAEGVIREEGYGTNHSLVIPELAQSSTYVYVISSRDKWGNEAKSDPYAVYTGAREISLFELIAGAVGDVFGWAVDK